MHRRTSHSNDDDVSTRARDKARGNRRLRRRRARRLSRPSGLAAVGYLSTMLLSYPVLAAAPPTEEGGKAAPKASDKGTSGADGGKGAPERRRRGKKRMTLEDEFLIEGKLEKPSAFYILRRSSLDYDWARLDARFTPLVLESVQDPLF